MPKSTYLSYLGIAKEATYGTPVAPTAFIPVTEFKPGDEIKWLEDKGYRGSMVDVYGMIAGPQTSSYDYGGNVHLDTIGYALAGLLGDVTTTGTAAPYTHAMAVLNGSNPAPPSYTLTDYVSGIETRQNPGTLFTEVAFKFTGSDLFSYSAKTVGTKSATTSTPTPSFGTLAPMAGWTGVVQIAGATSTVVLDGELTVKRTVNPLQTVGTQSPYAMWGGLVSVDGKFTLIMEDTTQLNNYLNGTNVAVDVKYTQGSNSLQLHASQCQYKTAVKERSKDYVELQVDFHSLANTTDVGASGGYSVLKATLVNSLPSGTYK